ncbi:MAG TPA: cobalamin-dependent protein, partial [bacterium]|nr:cobalamin-dependent protein [bacterium]
MKKRKIILFCAAPPTQLGVVENYALAHIYGLEYIRAFALRNPEIKKNYDIEVLSLPLDSLLEKIVDAIVCDAPEIVGLSCSLKNYFITLDIARQIKLAAPEIDIVVGGPEVFEPERIMEKNVCFDYAVMGEGEETFREFLLSRIRGAGPEEVAGLCYRKDGKPVRGSVRHPIKDINLLPSIIDRQRANDVSGVILYETARGCRHGCSYCLWSPYPKRYFSLNRVKRDLKNLLNNENVSRIFFIDSDFDSDQERAIAILRYFKENNSHGCKLSAFLSFDNMNPELLSLMGELCHEVPIGLQTVDNKCLNALGRAWFDLARFDASLPSVLRYIPADRLYIDIMYGLPYETPDVFLDTLLWCVKRGLNHINFFRLA